ncbi:hypothetical protein V5O48_003485 [Marasmius crinis-equi]|uniref:VHS domain-containing protein n=1 Tax=Marasmius crinis-equi TaxID=585013 RepID=A0ABR3FSY4_9AGAR
MSALNFARQVFNPEKPHSSITDWVDILTANTIAEEAYDGIPEIVDSINLQGTTGPAEASRAIRKKLKHGNPHQQYRALVILKALVENCGDKFKHSFADGQLTDAIRGIATNQYADQRVRKKLKLVLLSWHEQFKTEPSMRTVADLHLMFKDKEPRRYNADEVIYAPQRAEKDEAKRKAKQEKEEARERQRKEEEERKRQKHKPKTKRQPFNFEQEKPKVLASIVEASQASSNLVNAITLVNTEKESIETNERVQQCLEMAKHARKMIVRYVQLVENEEVIGVLIETNDRVITALEMYDQVLTAVNKGDTDKAEAIADGLAATHISHEGQLARLQDKQRAEVEKAKQRAAASSAGQNLHPDLEELSFGPLGASSSNLPPPIRPTGMSDEEDEVRRGSLSDFSDYESSDEAAHKTSPSSYRRKEWITVSDDSDDARAGIRNQTHEEDPFADPFADEAAVGSSRH